MVMLHYHDISALPTDNHEMDTAKYIDFDFKYILIFMCHTYCFVLISISNSTPKRRNYGRLAL